MELNGKVTEIYLVDQGLSSVRMNVEGVGQVIINGPQSFIQALKVSSGQMLALTVEVQPT